MLKRRPSQIFPCVRTANWDWFLFPLHYWNQHPKTADQGGQYRTDKDILKNRAIISN